MVVKEVRADMQRRVLLSIAVAALAMVWLTPGALAGGWAITTLDAVPRDMQAGETYRIGFLMRQHGVEPIRDGQPRIVIRMDGQEHSFRAVAEGAPGHYVAEVAFPREGEWTWAVDQAPFPMYQALGPIVIRTAAAVEAAPSMSVVELATVPDAVTEAVTPTSPLPDAAASESVVTDTRAVAAPSTTAPVAAPTLAVRTATAPAELALFGLVALAALGIALALRQVRPAEPARHST
jgi:hypothetical protein